MDQSWLTWPVAKSPRVAEQCDVNIQSTTQFHLSRGEKDFNDGHREITDFVQSIPGFQECDEDLETWMACDAEDCGFQMLNDDEIITSE
ncbi:uncharacterized protein TNCV_1156131 [Trichonephila clavipes]|nr:uncharacterized protein TNCV_1156131 [Trichonephila clavipes]